MSYTDPYAERNERYQQQYAEGLTYNPYDEDEGSLPSRHPDSYYKKEGKENPRSGFGDSFGANAVGVAKQQQGLRDWRFEHQNGSWTRGSRGSCIARFCCCTAMIVIFFIVSVLLALALWIQPPNIVVGNVQVNSSNPVQSTEGGFQINLGVNISVQNPNYFSVSFKDIDAQIFYPINDTQVGGGTENDITFGSHSQTNFTFPFAIKYNSDLPSSQKILSDLTEKCGIPTGPRSDITVTYDITLGLRILFFVVSPKVTNSLSFMCPLTSSDLEGLISGIGNL